VEQQCEEADKGECVEQHAGEGSSAPVGPQPANGEYDVKSEGYGDNQTDVLKSRRSRPVPIETGEDAKSRARRPAVFVEGLVDEDAMAEEGLKQRRPRPAAIQVRKAKIPVAVEELQDKRVKPVVRRSCPKKFQSHLAPQYNDDENENENPESEPHDPADPTETVVLDSERRSEGEVEGQTEGGGEERATPEEGKPRFRRPAAFLEDLVEEDDLPGEVSPSKARRPRPAAIQVSDVQSTAEEPLKTGPDIESQKT